jgi:hypothetical protein
MALKLNAKSCFIIALNSGRTFRYSIFGDDKGKAS